jgi:hypothetical protein
MGLSILPDVLGPWRPLSLLVPPRRGRAVSAEVGGAQASGSVTGFTMETQRRTRWCWAAVAVSVARKYDRQTQWTQCRVATDFYARGGDGFNCCGGDQDACNLSQALSEVFAVTGNLAGAATGSSIDYDSLCREIIGDRPVCARIGWPPTNEDGHFVTVTGFRTGADGTRYVDVQDPVDDGDPDNLKHFSLNEFSTNYDHVGGEWTWTYRTRRATS